ncbi:MAG TPA: thiamine diphosphokinase [Candidatus Eisenbacteria bacterium]|nr:thiamine diphosphokinase [Candidatus Eisenbacteria bacterium]
MLDVAIVLNGDIKNIIGFQSLLTQASYIIAVDGGLNHLIKLGIKPDIILGDQDSVSQTAMEKAEEWNIEVRKFPRNKDYTDSALALKTVLAQEIFVRDFSEKLTIAFLAAFGDRYDHLLSNQFLAEKHSDKVDFILSDGLNLQYILQGPKDLKLNWPPLDLENEGEFNFSLIAMSDQVGSISLKHALYPLEKYNLKHGESIGISNLLDSSKKKFLTLKDVEVSFEKGCLSIMIVPSI